MRPTELRLDPDDLKCLVRGGSLDFEIKDCEEVRTVVTLCIGRQEKGFRPPVKG